MEIQCQCGKFRAELSNFPAETPGRLRCYCDDCQSFMHHLGRAELLDANGGSEIVPVYPSNFKITQGKENLKCTKLSSEGMFRFSTACCNTPIANTDDKRPWVGMIWKGLKTNGPKKIEDHFGKVRASIMGKFAHGERPADVPEKFDFKGFRVVMPFILKGVVFGRKNPSPFFENGKPVGTMHVLSAEERAKAFAAAGHGKSKA